MMPMNTLGADFKNVVFPRKNVYESNCCYVQSKNTLVLTDRYAHTVYMYDTVEGTSRAITDQNIQEPRGCCVGPGDTVLVCSKNKNSIVHLTVDGDVLGTYPVDMEYLNSLCISKKASTLAVSNRLSGKKKLQLYNMLPA
ncbi:hypothetical protein DPMN_138185 [Dreissena polymorpha]|uniref:Uncharacterized protein n=1 Tax=Dreissena polymorpha TaxID=45954 RepID=A0A9D4G750_DREPO|nr:hypothetical protein DPMN_138185 [Dreissena polymorpha]